MASPAFLSSCKQPRVAVHKTYILVALQWMHHLLFQLLLIPICSTAYHILNHGWSRACRAFSCCRSPCAQRYRKSLLAGCASVYYAMYQLRTFGRLITSKDVKKWLRGLPREIKDSNKDIPSAAAVLVLDTPRGLVDMAAASFVCGLSIYVVFVFINNLDRGAGKNDNRNIVIAYFVSMWLCATLYSRSFVFDIYVGSTPTWKELARYLGFDYSLSPRALDAEIDTESADPQCIPPSRTKIDSFFVMNSLAPTTPQSASRQTEFNTRPANDNTLAQKNQTSTQSDDVESTEFSLALQNIIVARTKCLEADQRLLSFLEKQQAALGGRY